MFIVEEEAGVEDDDDVVERKEGRFRVGISSRK